MSDKDIVKGHISTRGMSAALDLAAAFGVNPRSILQRCGIQTERLALPDSQVPVSDYLHFLRLLRQQSGNADMGLYLGRISHLENMHLFMYLASTSGTMRDWLNRLPSVGEVMGDLGAIAVASDDDQFALQWHPSSGAAGARCLVTDSVLAAAAAQMDGFCAIPVKPVAVDLSYPEPDDLSALQQMFGKNLRFGKAPSALHYQRRVLDYPLVRLSTRFYDNVAREFSRPFSGDASESDPFILNLHASIRRQLPSGECRIETVAADLAMSRRTLQRRLKQRNTHFQQLLNGIKLDLARKYLEDRRLNTVDITVLLGYAEQSTFSAAFKSWTGMTPTEYRQSLSAAASEQPMAR
ncbi:MAG: AraC family transcriptional regulator ligand-binding domain-containing protein [Panacagrimonas sp.]